MNKKTGTIITIVVAVLTLCVSGCCCLFGILTLAGEGEWSSEIGVPQAGEINTAYGIPIVCLGILVWLAPLLLWFFLVRGKEDDAEADVLEAIG